MKGADRRRYSGEHRESGGNVQAVLEPDGFSLWPSDVEPGRTHDLTATGPREISNIVKAALVLAHFEHGRIAGKSLRPTP